MNGQAHGFGRLGPLGEPTLHGGGARQDRHGVDDVLIVVTDGLARVHRLGKTGVGIGGGVGPGRGGVTSGLRAFAQQVEDRIDQLGADRLMRVAAQDGIGGQEILRALLDLIGDETEGFGVDAGAVGAFDRADSGHEIPCAALIVGRQPAKGDAHIFAVDQGDVIAIPDQRAGLRIDEAKREIEFLDNVAEFHARTCAILETDNKALGLHEKILSVPALVFSVTPSQTT